MAIKAGRVGVDPSQVTLEGKIKGGGVSPEVLTKEEARRIYQTILGMQDYLSKTEASSLYQRISDMVNYQLKLVSGTNIKRINGEDLLGSGNISVLTNEIASGIYQTIQGMSNYVLKSEIPDTDNLVTKTEAPGYDDILTTHNANILLAEKLNIDGTSFSYKDVGDDVNDLATGLAIYPVGCVNTPSAATCLVISGGNNHIRIQIAYSFDFGLYYRFMPSNDTWGSWTNLLGNIENSITNLQNNKQNVLTVGRGIDITNNVITNQFSPVASPNLDNVDYYYAGYVTSATNSPYSGTRSGYLLSIVNKNSTGYREQLFCAYNADGWYLRKMTNSTWSSWEKLATISKPTITIGDVSFSNIIAKQQGDVVFLDGYVVSNAQTYTANSTVLFTTNVKPSANRFFAFFNYTSSGPAVYIAKWQADGKVVLNNTITFDSTTYLFFNAALSV